MMINPYLAFIKKNPVKSVTNLVDPQGAPWLRLI